ncbi:sugar ABC transporter ATP-binding protein [Paenarthrobacter nicotinovorans]|uniref:sugar ABC transporter ATP-binding protein n=1 Tax=Paenarthrobacter nicotinovorans TaxID=29320 RepID=UPI0037FA83CE
MAEHSPLRLQVTNLNKRYGAVRALSNANFELRAGEVMALLGENGAGKSTLVKTLSGLVRPDEGEIRVDGSLVDLKNSSASQEAGIGVVQQEYSTVPALSVAENLLMGESKARWLWSPRFLREHALPLLQKVGLGHINPRTRVEDLSSAEMQLLEVARVLAKDSKILIFDEPTAALSDTEAATVLDVVRRLANEGRSVIYVSHRLNEIFQVADRITIFRNGQSLSPSDVSDLKVEDIVRTMLGRELGDMYPPHGTADGEIGLSVDGLMAPGLLEPVSLDVRRGAILGLTGQLGSGASQFLQALAALVPVTQGRVQVDGLPVSTKNRGHGIRAGIAYCSPDRKKNGIFAGLPILRNLSSPWLASIATVGVISSHKEKSKAREIASNFTVDVTRMNSAVGTLSGGNQQKVVVGRWLGINPKVLLVDEPTRGVDVGARAEIYRQLRKLANEGVIIIVSSSDTEEIYGLCDVISTFSRGRLKTTRSHEDWTQVSLVADVMHNYEGATT